MSEQGLPDHDGGELERPAAFRWALRRFLARTDQVSARASLISQRYDLLLAVKTGDEAMRTVEDGYRSFVRVTMSWPDDGPKSARLR